MGCQVFGKTSTDGDTWGSGPTDVGTGIQTDDGRILYGSPAVVGVTQPDAIGTNSSVVIPLPPSINEVDVCYVELDQRATESKVVPELLSSIDATGGAVDAATPFAEPSDPVQRFIDDRPEQYLMLLLGLVGGVFAGLLMRSLKGELAAYLMSGTTRMHGSRLLLLQQAWLGGLFAFSGAAASAAVGYRSLDWAAEASLAIAGGAIWVLVSATVSIDLALRSPLTLAKDR